MYQAAIKVIEHSYPNPEYKYGVFSVLGKEIGLADKRGEGWVLRRKRKILSLTETAIALTKNNINDAQRRKVQAMTDENEAKKILEYITPKVTTCSRSVMKRVAAQTGVGK